MWVASIISCMFKVLQLIKKKPEISIEDFEEQVLETYAKTIKKVRGLRSFILNTAKRYHEVEEKPLDYVAELVFTNEKAFAQALENPDVKAAIEELKRVAEQPDFIYSEESVLKKPRAVAAKPKKVKKPARRAVKKPKKVRKAKRKAKRAGKK